MLNNVFILLLRREKLLLEENMFTFLKILLFVIITPFALKAIFSTASVSGNIMYADHAVKRIHKHYQNL